MMAQNVPTTSGYRGGCHADLTRVVLRETWGTGQLSDTTTTVSQYVCPDLLRYEQIGAADNWRGRVVRAFFWLMRVWPAKG